MLYIFDREENLKEILTEYKEFKYIKKLNSDRSISFETEKNNNIKKYNKVGFFDKDMKFQLFFIDDLTSFKDSDNEKISVDCLADFYRLGNTLIDDKRATTIQDAVAKALEGSDYKVGIVESFEDRNINFYHISRIKALNEIINTYKCEIDIRVEIDEGTGRISNKFIDFKHRLGEDTGIRFTYDTALESVEKSTLDGHFNVLWAWGKSLETEEGGYSRKLDFADINSGKKYIEDTESIAKYGRIEGIFEDSKIEDKGILLKATKEKLKETKELKMSYKASVKDISTLIGYEHFKINIGDTIVILDEEINDIVEARIIAIEENKEDEKSESDIKITLGNFLPALSDDDLDDILGNLNDKIDNIPKPDIPNIDTIYPDTLPKLPTLKAKGLFSSIMLEWTFENKNYYTYEIFASKIKNFMPDSSNRIFEGKASSYLHQVGVSETWYYRVRGKNSYDKVTNYSLQIETSTRKIVDGSEIFEEAAIGHALIGELDADKITTGTLKGHLIDAKNLTLTDGNGKETIKADDWGNVSLDVKELKINSKDVAKILDTSTEKITEIEQKITSEAITNVVKETLNVTGVENLLEVGNFSKNKNLAKSFWQTYNTSWYESDYYGLGIHVNSGEEGYIGSNYIDVVNIRDRKVSLSANIMAEDNTLGADIYIIGCRDKNIGGYDWTLRVADIAPNYKWTKVNVSNIDIPEEINHIWIRIDNDGRRNPDSDASVVVFVDYINLVIGENVINSPIAESGELKNLKSEYSTFKEQTSNSFTQQAQSINNVNSSLTEFKQDTNNFIFKSERKGTANLLKSANGKKAYHSGDWELRKWNTNLAPKIGYLSYGDAWSYPDPTVNTFQLSIYDGWGMWGGDVGIIQNNVKVTKGETYTISAYVAGHRHNDCYLYVRGAASNDYELIASVAFTPPSGGTDKNNWGFIHTTFIAQRDYCHIEFGMRNGGEADPYLWFAKPMLNKGSLLAEFTDSLNEIHTGITKIDSDGVRCDFEDGTHASMGRNGFNYYKDGMSKPYQYITFNAKISNIRNGYWAHVQLPAFFRGKQINHDFQLFVTLGNYNLNAHVSGSINGALRVAFAEWTNWNASDAVIQVRPCFQKIGLDTGKLYGWDGASTSSGATPNEGAGDVIVFAQM